MRNRPIELPLRSLRIDGVVEIRLIVAGLVLSALFVAFVLWYGSAPWAAALFACAFVLLLLAVPIRSASLRVVLVNAAAVLAAIASYEAYLGRQRAEGDGTRIESSIPEGEYIRLDDTLGYTPPKNVQVRVRKYYQNTLLYDVVYTTGPEGLRVSPPVEGAPAGCIVFFGDSLTFGEGVNDRETMPYQVGLKSAGQYAIYNFAFSGYGPHQMLANLQAGRVQEIVRCKRTQFIYLALLEHISRVAGLTNWDRHGPRFALNEKGMPVRAGNFDDASRLIAGVRMPSVVSNGLQHFLAWQRFFGRARDATPADLDLFVAVTTASVRLAKQLYPDSAFQIILHDSRFVGNVRDPRVDAIEKKLAAGGIAISRLTSIVPDFPEHWQRYVISEHDQHPNPLLDERMADYIVKRILK